MIETLDRSAGPIVGLRVDDTVTKDDYERVTPVLDRVIQEHGELNLLLRIDDLSSVEPGAVWEDLKFDVQHLRDIACCAVVTDEAWLRRSARVTGPPFGIEVRAFHSAEEDAAWSWLKDTTPDSDGATAKLVATQRRTHRARQRLTDLTDQLRHDIARLEDPRAEALFETAAEVLGGLGNAFEHFEKRAEEAWQAT